MGRRIGGAEGASGNAKNLVDLVNDARVVVEAERVKLARLEADRAAAMAELESLEDRAGAEVLDDPEAAPRLSRVMQELRDRVGILARAIAAQGLRVTAAEQTYLTAEADELERTVLAPAREVLADHEQKIADMVAKIVEIEGEGRFVTEAERITHEHDLARHGPVSYRVPTSTLLRQAVEEASRQVQLVRAMAAGEDPDALVTQWQRHEFSWSGLANEDLYPACVWGPDAIAPAPAYLRQVHQEVASQVGPEDDEPSAAAVPEEAVTP